MTRALQHVEVQLSEMLRKILKQTYVGKTPKVK